MFLDSSSIITLIFDTFGDVGRVVGYVLVGGIKLWAIDRIFWGAADVACCNVGDFVAIDVKSVDGWRQDGIVATWVAYNCAGRSDFIGFNGVKYWVFADWVGKGATCLVKHYVVARPEGDCITWVDKFFASACYTTCGCSWGDGEAWGVNGVGYAFCCRKVIATSISFDNPWFHRVGTQCGRVDIKSNITIADSRGSACTIYKVDYCVDFVNSIDCCTFYCSSKLL